ncbi:MAG: LysR family transcriptional regulator [Vicinamibacterales bacterium]
MTPALEVRHLALVDAIAESGSVTRAADRLHLTQSALSHQLRAIESRLGVRLFLRAGRRMVLTPAGARARAAAARVLDDLARTEQDLRAMADGDRGVLRLCTQCNTGYHWLPPLLKAFHADHPGIDVQIQIGATDHPVAALFSGEIDLAVMTDPVRDPRLRAASLFRDELVAVVAPDHAWASCRSIRPADFAGEHLILYSADRPTSYTFTRVLGPAGVEPARVSAVPLTEAIVELVAAGMGVGVLARWSVEPALASGKVAGVRIGPRGVYRTWSAVSLRDRPAPRWLDAFVALVARRAAPARAAGRRRRETR